MPSDKDIPTMDEILQECGFPTSVDSFFDPDRKGTLYNQESMLVAYRRGYKLAADLLVEKYQMASPTRYLLCGERWIYRDVLYYPVLYLYRHYLELTLKDLIGRYRKLDDIESLNYSAMKGHKLNCLWDILMKHISEHRGTSEFEVQIGRLLKELDKVDLKSTTFRYPEDHKGNPSLQGDFYIDPERAKEIMDKICEYFECAELGMDAELNV